MSRNTRPIVGVLVAIFAATALAQELCEQVVLKPGDGIDVVGTWDIIVHTKAIITCQRRAQYCTYKFNETSPEVELFAENLVWGPNGTSHCDTIVAGKFTFENLKGAGNLPVLIAIVLAVSALLVVFCGFLAYFSNPKAYCGRILRGNPQPTPSPPESPEIQTNQGRELDVVVSMAGPSTRERPQVSQF